MCWHIWGRKRLLRRNDKPSVCAADKKIDKNSVTNSATGIASHTPVTPKMAGSVRSDSRIKTKVLVKDMTAEVLPSESAVKRADEKIL